jgi:hypothetical protein
MIVVLIAVGIFIGMLIFKPKPQTLPIAVPQEEEVPKDFTPIIEELFGKEFMDYGDRSTRFVEFMEQPPDQERSLHLLILSAWALKNTGLTPLKAWITALVTLFLSKSENWEEKVEADKAIKSAEAWIKTPLGVGWMDWGSECAKSTLPKHLRG